MDSKIYELHKRIMKNDMDTIDEIETLEEAKEIIKMIVSNIFLSTLSALSGKGKHIKEDF